MRGLNHLHPREAIMIANFITPIRHAKMFHYSKNFGMYFFQPDAFIFFKNAGFEFMDEYDGHDFLKQVFLFGTDEEELWDKETEDSLDDFCELMSIYKNTMKYGYLVFPPEDLERMLSADGITKRRKPVYERFENILKFKKNEL